MKNTIKFFAASLLIVGLLFTLACSSDNDSNNSSDLFIKFTSGGTTYNNPDPETINSLAKTINYNTFLEDQPFQITLYMPLTPVLGTHDITDEPSNVESYGARYTNGVTDVEMTATSGIIDITEVTATLVKGTFSFSGSNGDGSIVEVTNGSFVALK
jgi:hypothetical protein